MSKFHFKITVALNLFLHFCSFLTIIVPSPPSPYGGHFSTLPSNPMLFPRDGRENALIPVSVKKKERVKGAHPPFFPPVLSIKKRRKKGILEGEECRKVLWSCATYPKDYYNIFVGFLPHIFLENVTLPTLPFSFPPGLPSRAFKIFIISLLRSHSLGGGGDNEKWGAKWKKWEKGIVDQVMDEPFLFHYRV